MKFFRLFMAVVLSYGFCVGPAYAGCYITVQGDYICDGSSGGPGVYFPPATPGPAPGPGSSNPGTGPTPIFLPSGPACKGGTDYAAFKKHLIAREGYSRTVYKDSLGKPTVGVGHLVLPGDGLAVGDVITDAQVQAFLDKDALASWNAGQSQAASAGISSPCFALALGSVNYQLGTGWRAKFPTIWGMIVAGQYQEAVAALNNTLWKKQTPVRVKDFQDALLALPKKQ